jgi:hypothetical protein
MTLALLRRLSVALVVALGATGSSFALTVPELQRLLQDSPPKAVAFTETRESPWLAVPAETRGTMHSKPGVLEKRVEMPRKEIWRMLPDRVEYVGPGDTGSKQILFSQSPAVAVLADALRRVVAGELLALERDFRIDLRGDRSAWTARLKPTAAGAARYLDHLELEGAGAELRVITVVERQGERTTTRLYP